MPPRRPHWFPGGPPGDAPLGGSAGLRGLFNPISRVPNWMRQALGLTADELPNRLRADQVVPAVEFGQQGWGFVDYLPLRFDISGGGIVFLPELGIDPTVIRRLIYIQAQTNSPVNQSLEIILRFPALGLVPAIVDTLITSTVLAPAGVLASHAEITQGVGVVIPPGGQLGFDSDVPGPLLVTVSMLWATFPAGYPLPI